MKPVRVLLPIVLAGAVLLLVLSRLGSSGEAQAFRLERDALRREMLERSAVARGLAGPQGAEEAAAVLGWWFDGVAALRKAHPKQSFAPDAPAAGGKEAKRDDAEWRRYAEERLAALRAGYRPVFGGAESGLRLDVLAVAPGEHPQTHERGLRIDFALWGAPRRLEREAAGPGDASRAPLHVVVPVAFRQLAFRFVDAGGKTYGEMSGSGEPYLAIRDPERFTAELPPGVVLGTWWVEAFPREAARVEVSVALQVQGMTSAALAPAFRWEVPVAESWQLRPGEAFRAETREVPVDPAPPKK